MASKVALTATRVAGFKCPPEKKQAFLWDAGQKSFALPATPGGKPFLRFQSRFHGAAIRMTIWQS
ncbi:MAG: hypothetical protein U5K56_09950 [Halioglobus sp.]|nr:hypothetical protein [Halioglobus sp.]